MKKVTLSLMATIMLLLAACSPGINLEQQPTPSPTAQPPPLGLSQRSDGGVGTDEVIGPTGAVFSARCAYSHTLSDDPIVAHGQPGWSHPHDFFGNRGTNAFSTGATLAASPSTTCDQTGDTASYWSPVLFSHGIQVKPFGTDVYYRDGGIDLEFLRAYPPGLVMIAGDPNASVPQDIRIMQWGCTGESSAVLGTVRPHDCGTANIRAKIEFPTCWDGVNLDSPDHRSHMAYPWADDGTRNDCPATHPVGLPALDFGVRWRISDATKLRLSSGRIIGFHADFINGWQQPDLERLVNDCLLASIKCGTIFGP